MTPRLWLAVLLPFAAGGLQWLLWTPWIRPYVWFLFFPAAFFSAWLGGLRGGVAGTLIGALLVWYFFIPPPLSLALKETSSIASLLLFIVMGCLFAWFFERLREAMRRTDAALKATEAANAKITRLYEKTVELDELKSQFFANVSHELRTPLTLIMAPLEQKLRRAGMADGDRRETEMMLRNARLLYRHVADLLDAAKLEAGGMRVDYGRLDLAALVRALASHFDSVARERAIAYRIEVPAALPVEADSEKVQRILLNLLANAFKFTGDGGAIEVRLYVAGEAAVLEVQDNGPGVPADQREVVFERFRQLEGGANRRHGGTGLGLAIVREFAQLHGGRASVTAAPGGGALFAVWLPRQAPVGTAVDETTVRVDPAINRQVVDEAAAQTSASAAPDLCSRPLVLVVEDNADMSAFVADCLGSRYRVVCARDGRDGLEKARTMHPDLILADVMMPAMSGDDMVLALRQQPELAGVPIVMLTAKADDALRVRLLEAGVQAYLAKPFTVDELLARVGGLLAERGRTQALLLASERRFEATFDQAAVGIALVAPDGRWLKVNRRLCAIVGYGEAELLKKNLQEITHPDDLSPNLEFMRRMLSREITTYALEKRYLRKDGRVVWINLTVALVWKADGDPDYFISVVEDIDARKQAEDELRRRNAELERFERAAVDRELEMIRLKREINALAKEAGRPAPHDLSFVDTPAENGAP